MTAKRSPTMDDPAGGDGKPLPGRVGLVTPEPRKRPKSSYLRSEAELPSECWQAGFTHYPLAGGTGTEILTWLDGVRSAWERGEPGEQSNALVDTQGGVRRTG